MGSDDLAGTEPVAEGEVLTSDAVAGIAHGRAAFGLRADDGYIRELHANPVRHNVVEASSLLLLGLRLTADEAEAILDRRALEPAALEVEKTAAQVLPDRFGGVYIANGEGAHGELHVLTVGALNENDRDDLLVGLDPNERERVVVDSAAFTQDQMMDGAAEAAAVLESTEVPYGGTYADVTRGAIVIRTDAPNEAAAVLEGVKTSAPLLFEPGAAPVTTGALKTDPLAFGLVIGGQALKRVGSGSQFDCTSAFGATGPFGPMLLTAGHCGGVNSTWQQGGINAGTLVTRDFSTAGRDAAQISTAGLRTQTGRIHLDWFRYYEPVHFLTPGDAVGFPVCNSGATSGQLGLATPPCGTIRARNYCYPGHGCGWRTSDYLVDVGDSGAGVFRDTIYGRSAEGIQSSCFPDASGHCRTSGTTAIYGYLPPALSAWGLTLLAP